MSNDITFSNYTNTTDVFVQLCDSPSFYTDRSQCIQSNATPPIAATAATTTIATNKVQRHFQFWLSEIINSLIINHVHYYYLASTHWKWIFMFRLKLINTYKHIT